MKSKPLYACAHCRRVITVRTDAQGRCGQCRSGTPAPSPEEIKQVCAEIQAGWSEYEEQLRRVVKNNSHDYESRARVSDH